MKNNDEKEYLTPGEVAKILMVSGAAVRRWAEKGEINALTTPGGHRRFLYSDVQRFADERNFVLQGSSRNRLRILIVDDDKHFSGYLMKLLGKYPEQAEVDVANDGFAAGIKVRDFKPDVVLLDLMMPGMNGFQVCELLKSFNGGNLIRVIAMTGYPSPENVEKILSLGAEACLSKPVDRVELLEKLGITIEAKA